VYVDLASLTYTQVCEFFLHNEPCFLEETKWTEVWMSRAGVSQPLFAPNHVLTLEIVALMFRLPGIVSRTTNLICHDRVASSRDTEDGRHKMTFEKRRLAVLEDANRLRRDYFAWRERLDHALRHEPGVASGFARNIMNVLHLLNEVDHVKSAEETLHDANTASLTLPESFSRHEILGTALVLHSYVSRIQSSATTSLHERGEFEAEAQDAANAVTRLYGKATASPEVGSYRAGFYLAQKASLARSILITEHLWKPEHGVEGEVIERWRFVQFCRAVPRRFAKNKSRGERRKGA
jgi:hypothetical protein